MVNEDELIQLLKSYNCELRLVEYNSTSSLYEQLLAMRGTGIYISVHTSNLANAPLLQPGSAVFELIHVCACCYSPVRRCLNPYMRVPAATARLGGV